MAHRQFRLPDLGEGLTEADIVRWLVDAGDPVAVNQPLVEVETAKAVVEIPSPYAGVVVERHCAAGQTLAVGAPLVTIDAVLDTPDGAPADSTPGAAAASPPAPTARRPDEDTAGARQAAAQGEALFPAGTADADRLGGAESSPGAAGAGERTPVLVGYGPRTAERGRRRRRPRPAPPPGPQAPSGPSLSPPAPGPVPPAVQGLSGRGTGRVLAKPPVRKLARDLGVDLATIVGTGPGGSISREDVESAVRTAAPQQAAAGVTAMPGYGPTAPTAPPSPTVPGAPGAAPGAAPGQPSYRQVGAIPDGARFDAAGRVWRIPVTGLRRSMAGAMVSSFYSAPHVTEFLTVDVTETMAARDRIAALPEFAGIRVTPLLLVAKALLIAVRRHPMINSTWVDGGDQAEIVVHEQVNLGIAVAGPRGLVVPNIPDAGRRDLVGLARGLQELTAAAREDRLTPADLRGSTITITNVGVLGVDIGTPILNPGEAAILALGAIRPAPWVHEGQLAVRTVAQLALSFDHRIVDGELGAAVLADVGAILTDPTRALAWS